MKDLEDRKIPISIKAKWLQQAMEEGLSDVDSYIESLKNTINKKHRQYEEMEKVRDNLSNVITEAAALLKEIEEAIEQGKDLKIFPSKIEEFLQKIKR